MQGPGSSEVVSTSMQSPNPENMTQVPWCLASVQQQAAVPNDLSTAVPGLVIAAGSMRVRDLSAGS